MAGRNATWALISEEKVMNIIDCQSGYEMANQLARLCYGDKAFAVDINQWSCSIGEIYRNSTFYQIDAETNELIPLIKLATQEEEIQFLKDETSELSAVVYPKIDADNCTLEELKVWQINLSKTNMACYLKNHPLVSSCHANKKGTYTITEEKKNIFNSKFMAHKVLTSANIPDIMTWNEAGQTCEEWTDEECLHLLIEWNDITQSLVQHQQNTEIKINEATTKEEVLNVKCNYEKADIRNLK